VTVADSQAQLLDAMTGKVRQRFGSSPRSGFRSRSSLFRSGPAPFTLSGDGRALALLQTETSRVEPGTSRLTRVSHSTAFVWNVQTGKELGHFEVSLPDQRASLFRTLGAKLLPDGSLLAIWGPEEDKGTILLLDPATGKEKGRVSLDSAPDNIAFTPDGRTMLASHVGGVLDVVDMRTGKIRAAWRLTGGSCTSPPMAKR